MTTGRTVDKWTRVYMDGYDVSGFGRTIGPEEITYDEHDLTADMSDTIKGYLPGRAHVNIGNFNGVFDNTATTGAHAVLGGTVGGKRVVLAAHGQLAAPAAGDATFGGEFMHKAYQAVGEGAVTITVPFSGWATDSTTLLYAAPWGLLLHPSGAETAANTGTGVDCYQQTQTTKGGFLIYQILSSNAAGTVTLSVDDSANNSSFLALSGATTGAIAYTSIPTAGIIAIGTGATVRQYLRWQIALAGGMTTCTFVLAFNRS